VSELENYWGSVSVGCSCEKLVAEAGESSGTQRKVNICIGSCYQATSSEDCNRLRRPSVSYNDL
jgi:hypothetical protein